jgi:hypothetical protein
MRRPIRAIVLEHGPGRNAAIGAIVPEPPQEHALGVSEAVPGQATSVIGAHHRSAHRTARTPAAQADGKFSVARGEPAGTGVKIEID